MMNFFIGCLLFAAIHWAIVSYTTHRRHKKIRDFLWKLGFEILEVPNWISDHNKYVFSRDKIVIQATMDDAYEEILKSLWVEREYAKKTKVDPKRS